MRNTLVALLHVFPSPSLSLPVLCYAIRSLLKRGSISPPPACHYILAFAAAYVGKLIKHNENLIHYSPKTSQKTVRYVTLRGTWGWKNVGGGGHLNEKIT